MSRNVGPWGRLYKYCNITLRIIDTSLFPCFCLIKSASHLLLSLCSCSSSYFQTWHKEFLNHVSCFRVTDFNSGSSILPARFQSLPVTAIVRRNVSSPDSDSDLDCKDMEITVQPAAVYPLSGVVLPKSAPDPDPTHNSRIRCYFCN